MTQPTTQQINAVRAIIYNKRTVQTLSDDVQSINTFLYPGGDGLQWTYPDTGAVTSEIQTAAQRAQSLAAMLTTIAQQLGGLSTIPAADRRNLVATFTAEAAAWTARSQAWLSPQTASASTQQQLQAIQAHEAAMATAAAKVAPYFKQNDPVNR